MLSIRKFPLWHNPVVGAQHTHMLLITLWYARNSLPHLIIRLYADAANCLSVSSIPEIPFRHLPKYHLYHTTHSHTPPVPYAKHKKHKEFGRAGRQAGNGIWQTFLSDLSICLYTPSNNNNNNIMVISEITFNGYYNFMRLPIAPPYLIRYIYILVIVTISFN